MPKLNEAKELLTLAKYGELPSITIELKDILSLEADVNYSTINYLNEGELEQRRTSKTLKYYEKESLNSDFLRIHRNTIINTKYFSEIIDESYIQIQYKDQDHNNNNIEYLISRRRQKEVAEKLA